MRPMSEKIIPEHIDPFRYAEQSLSLDGMVKLADLKRLEANLINREGEIAVQLQFGKDEQKITFLKGHLNTKLSLQCQRCMEPFVYEIMSDFSLGIVTSLDEANDLPERYEPAMVTEGSMALRELIEDEIILNLPIIPRHEPDECKVQLPLIDSGWKQGEGENPFHVLETLKNKRQS
jgi:uncharacterized protein